MPPGGIGSSLFRASNTPGSSQPCWVAVQVLTDARKKALRLGASLSAWITSISKVWPRAGFAYAQAVGVIKSLFGGGLYSAK